MANEVTITFTFDAERWERDLMREWALHAVTEWDAVTEAMIKRVPEYISTGKPKDPLDAEIIG